MYSLRQKVFWWSLYSRGFVLTLAVLAHVAFPSHEPSDAFAWVPIDRPPGRQPESAADLAPPTSETVMDQGRKEGRMEKQQHHRQT